MVFEHGMTLVGSREDLDERVRVQGPAGINGVVVQDILRRMSGSPTSGSTRRRMSGNPMNGSTPRRIRSSAASGADYSAASRVLRAG